MAIRGLRITGTARGEYNTITYTRSGAGAVLVGEPRTYRGSGTSVEEMEVNIATDIQRRVTSSVAGGYPIELIETVRLRVYSAQQRFRDGLRRFDGATQETISGGDTTRYNQPPSGGQVDYRRRINRAWTAFQLRETEAGRKPTQAQFSREVGIPVTTLYGWIWAPPERRRTPTKIGQKRQITTVAKKLGIVEKRGGRYQDVYTTNPGENVVIIPPDIAEQLGIAELYSEFTDISKIPRSASEIRSALF